MASEFIGRDSMIADEFNSLESALGLEPINEECQSLPSRAFGSYANHAPEGLRSLKESNLMSANRGNSGCFKSTWAATDHSQFDGMRSG
jgi:hypothetical protein